MKRRRAALVKDVLMLVPPTDPVDLIHRYLPDWRPAVIFDVGANVGRFAKAYAQHFPDAEIHCFEPSPATYLDLLLSVARHRKVVAHNLALGQEDATLTLTQQTHSAMNHLLPAQAEQKAAVKVQVRVGADVMRELKVDHIDFLKIDTEGHDLAVLQGFLPVIDRIDFIQVEAAMNPYNTTHVPFGTLDGLLREQGFHLFYIFEQKLEWKRGGRPVLRRSDPLFISRRLLDLQGIS